MLWNSLQLNQGTRRAQRGAGWPRGGDGHPAKEIPCVWIVKPKRTVENKGKAPHTTSFATRLPQLDRFNRLGLGRGSACLATDAGGQTFAAQDAESVTSDIPRAHNLR